MPEFVMGFDIGSKVIRFFSVHFLIALASLVGPSHSCYADPDSLTGFDPKELEAYRQERLASQWPAERERSLSSLEEKVVAWHQSQRNGSDQKEVEKAKEAVDTALDKHRVLLKVHFNDVKKRQPANDRLVQRELHTDLRKIGYE